MPSREGGEKFSVDGIIEKLDDNTVVVTELPVGKWTQDYKEFLEKLMPGGNAEKEKAEAKKKKAAEKAASSKSAVNSDDDDDDSDAVNKKKGKKKEKVSVDFQIEVCSFIFSECV